MKTLPLRELMRRPIEVKKLTAKGESVRITDNGKPLWVLTPDRDNDEADEAKEKARQEWMDGYFKDLLSQQPQTGKSVAEIVIDSRGEY
ncbi:MAG: hypothetical protein JWO94_1603 [Verrucomicrobiaceae bacterium]|nr:hypothetical protein [Verrucomicrobiaceae bacterium]